MTSFYLDIFDIPYVTIFSGTELDLVFVKKVRLLRIFESLLTTYEPRSNLQVARLAKHWLAQKYGSR